MAWTAATRGDYVRASGTYASDVTDGEWALIAPLLPAARPGGRPRLACLRRVVNAIFYLLQTGCQWRMLPRDFPPRSTVYGYFRTWIVAGVWTHVHDVLYRRSRELEGREGSPTAAIIVILAPAGLRPEALHRGRSPSGSNRWRLRWLTLDQRAVDAEVLARQQPLHARRGEQRRRNRAAMSPASSRSRIFDKVEWSQTGSSMPRPTDQRNSRSNSSRSIS